MINNKKTREKPFDRNKISPRQNIFLLPPFIVLGTHNSFTDFYITPLALFPYRANYVSEIEVFQPYGEWVCRQAGCLYQWQRKEVEREIDKNNYYLEIKVRIKLLPNVRKFINSICYRVFK